MNAPKSTSETLDWDAAQTDRRTRHGVKLTLKDVRAIIEIWELPPFLTAKQAAELYHHTIDALRNHVSEGRFKRSAITGKPLMFVTTRFIQEIAARSKGGRS